MRPRVWIAGLLGLAGAARLLRRRRDSNSLLQADPAEELRAKLAEARAAAADRDEFEAGETPVDEADVESRRRAVHDAGREAIDRMRDGS